MRKRESSATKQARFDKLFAQMKYCPICGGELKLMGNRIGAALKTCDQYHGVMYVTGQRFGKKVGMFMEIGEE